MKRAIKREAAERAQLSDVSSGWDVALEAIRNGEG
jgi:hypothetical protein